MKTKLPPRSELIKSRLEEIVKMTLEVAEQKLAMIILFGSYARGDWVQDEYQESNITYSYQSDLDILLVSKKGKHIKSLETGIEETVEKRLNRKALFYPRPRSPWATFIVESIDRLNKELEKGHYFFCDIKKEGVILYDSGEFMLCEAGKLPWTEKREIAKEDYEYWFEKGVECITDAHNIFGRGNFNKSAFELHQATESFYNAILLVFSGYKPKSHDIKKLGSMVGNYNEELWQIFPQGSIEQQQCFNLLKLAYIESRYDRNYKINEQQLRYLIARVEKLRQVTERVCLKRLDSKEI